MKLKQYTRFQMNFSGKWVNVCGALMGVSFFLRIVYYFGLTNLADIGMGEILVEMALGILICGLFLLLLSCIHLNAPGLYGILGTAYCLILIVGLFSGGWVRILLGTVWYLLSAVVLLATVGGYLPGKLLSAGMFAFALLIRFFCFDLGKLGLFTWVLEASNLCAIAGLVCLPMSLKPAKLRKSVQ